MLSTRIILTDAVTDEKKILLVFFEVVILFMVNVKKSEVNIFLYLQITQRFRILVVLEAVV